MAHPGLLLLAPRALLLLLRECTRHFAAGGPRIRPSRDARDRA
jgi:hypothetical protein